MGLFSRLSGALAMFGFRPGRYPDPPPKGLENLPPAPGYLVRTFPSAQAASDWCRAWGVGTGPDDFNHHMTGGCVVYPLKAIGIPAESLVGKGMYDALISHEDLHTYNVVHGPDDKGWYLNGPIPAGIDPKIAQALAALPKTPAYAAASRTGDPTAAPSMTAATIPQVPPGLMGSSARSSGQ
jgi:hypothetical protein